MDSPLLALTIARLKEVFRDPAAVFWMFGFPLLVTITLGIAFRPEGTTSSRVAVTSGPRAASLAATLAASELRIEILPEQEAARALRHGGILLTVEQVDRPSPRILYRFDPSRPEASAARQLANDLLQRRAGRIDALPAIDQPLVARGARYIDWLVPGLLGMQLLSGGLWGAPWPIVQARQRKLLKRLAATPMRRHHYLLSFRIAGLVFVPLQTLVLFVFARLTFGVVVQGSALAVLALALVGSWSFAGLGLLCASRARSSESVQGFANLITLPMLVLSGVFFSSSRFPDSLQPLVRLLPLSAFNEALRQISNDGASLFAQGCPLAVLVVWGLVTSAVALRVFRWT